MESQTRFFSGRFNLRKPVSIECNTASCPYWTAPVIHEPFGSKYESSRAVILNINLTSNGGETSLPILNCSAGNKPFHKSVLINRVRKDGGYCKTSDS